MKTKKRFFGLLVVLLWLICIFTACSPSNHGINTDNHHPVNASKTGTDFQIIVKLTESATIDSLTSAFTQYKLTALQCLSPENNMWLLSAKAANNYALVEIIRKNKFVEAAEINTAILPR